MAQRLPDELIALVHHIELTEAHWWDRALQRFVIGIVSSTGAIHPAELPWILRREYGVEITVAALKPQVAALLEDGDLIELPDGRVKLSESTASQVREDVEQARAQEARVQERFLMALTEAGVDKDPNEAWEQFQEGVLTPVVQELGARTYELLERDAAANAPANFLAAVGNALDAYDEREKSAVVSFLDPDDPDVRAYLLRTLNAYFFLQASALSAETLSSLREAQTTQHEMRVLVDTNFLFSILRLHNNPANEVAETADALLARIRDRLRVRLYVLPITVAEARNTLGVHIETLSGIRLSRNLARAVVDESDLPGLTQRYLQEAANSEIPLTPEDFFSPYESNLVAVLRERGVELFNVKLDDYRTDQAVIDDVLAEEEYQKAKRLRGPKPYESNLHDVVLWHFVTDRRPAVVESPLDAQYWIVTEDFHFMAFDRWKRYRRGLPVCLSPAVLMQLLRFWVPRSEELEKALVASIRAPFLFPTFDVEAERLTARILRVLSRYEGIADLSVETIKQILMSEALRQRIGDAEPGAEEEAILREAFVQQTRLMEEKVQSLEAERASEAARSTTLARELEDGATEAVRLASLVESDRQRIQELVGRLDEAQRDSTRREEESSKRESRLQMEREQDAKRWFALTACLAFIVCSGIGVAVWFGLGELPWPEWLRLLAGAIAGIGVWLVLCRFVGARLLRLQNWGPVVALERIRVALWASIGAIVVAVLATAIYDAVF